MAKHIKLDELLLILRVPMQFYLITGKKENFLFNSFFLVNLK